MKPMLSSPPGVFSYLPRQRARSVPSRPASIFSPPRLSSPKLRQSRRRKDASAGSGWLRTSSGSRWPTSRSDWRLRLAGHKPPRRMACDDLLSVSGGLPPEHLKLFAHKRSSKPGTGSPLLTGGCCQPAAATVARTSPRCDVAVVSRVWWSVSLPLVTGRCHRDISLSLPAHAAVPLAARVDLAFTLARLSSPALVYFS
jgi:hypothetical protein